MPGVRISPWTAERINAIERCLIDGIPQREIAAQVNALDGPLIHRDTIKRRVKEMRADMVIPVIEPAQVPGRPTICFWTPSSAPKPVAAPLRVRAIQPAIPADRVPRERKQIRFEGEPGGFSIMASAVG